MAAATASVPKALGLEVGGEMLWVAWSDGRRSRFPAVWLADNRPETRRGPEGQRLVDALELPETVSLRSATIAGTAVEIAFGCFDQPSRFDATWLRDHALDAASRAERRREPKLWDVGLAENLPSQTYDAVASDPQAFLNQVTTSQPRPHSIRARSSASAREP